MRYLALLLFMIPRGYPCGEWLTVQSQGPGFVLVKMHHHIVGCPAPFRTIQLDGNEIHPLWLSTGPTATDGAFVVHAEPGPHTITVEDYCPPPCGCTACSSLEVELE